MQPNSSTEVYEARTPDELRLQAEENRLRYSVAAAEYKSRFLLVTDRQLEPAERFEVPDSARNED